MDISTETRALATMRAAAFLVSRSPAPHHRRVVLVLDNIIIIVVVIIIALFERPHPPRTCSVAGCSSCGCAVVGAAAIITAQSAGVASVVKENFQAAAEDTRNSPISTAVDWEI